MPRDDVKAAHQQAVLLFRDEHGLLLCAGPAECAGAKPFVKQEKTIALPEEAFDTVISSATEKEQGIPVKRIQAELMADDGSQSIDPTPEIRKSAGDIDLLKSGCII